MLLRICLISSILVAFAIPALPQSNSRAGRQAPRKTAGSTQSREITKPPPASEPDSAAVPAPSPLGEPQAETLKIDTNLVTVPAIASSVEGNYISDLRQEEFNISEDGQQQQVAFFATVSAPFHVVLLLDTSASTRQKLALIQKAAVAFVEKLQGTDQVKLISFDDQVRELSEFTSDRATLKDAIYRTVSGQGTKLYDAFEVALSSIKTIRGRKAIVLFTDGVDWTSDHASFDSTLHWLDEEGVIVYPIRYETRAESEQIVRQATGDPSNQLPTIDVIRTPPSGTTAPTFPSDDPNSVPTSGRRTGPLGLPPAGDILRGRRQRDPNTDRYPSPDRLPPTTNPSDPRDRSPFPDDRRDTRTSPDDPRDPTRPSSRGTRRQPDATTVLLDRLYSIADTYLDELAKKSGGRLLRADTLESLPDAFAKIAAELRTQYAIGYYPTNKARDGQYRKIRVTTTRKNVVVRARPGYRAPTGE
jgi:hypothetical protein